MDKPQAAYAIGIDVGGTTIKAIIASRDGSITDSWQEPTPPGGDGVTEAVAGLVRRIRSEISSDVLRGLAAPLTVAVPGIVDDDAGLAELSVNLGWEHYPMRDALSSALGEPVHLAHDVRSGALGESRWGAGGDTFMYVPIGTGIASAVLLGGKPLLPHPWSGEIGQLPVPDPSGAGLVALERVSSAAALARRFREARPQFPEGAGAREVFEYAAAGDARAQRIIDDGLSALGSALMTAMHVLGPIPIVIGGGLAGAGEAVSEPLSRAITPAESILPRPEIRMARLGQWSQALGTAAHSFDVSDSQETA